MKFINPVFLWFLYDYGIIWSYEIWIKYQRVKWSAYAKKGENELCKYVDVHLFIKLGQSN